MLEAGVQAQIRLEASRRGWKLFRNNVGVLLDAKGRPVRYGLANDSKQVNTMVKSGDLVGIRPVVITAQMVGGVIGQFVSIECKRPGWRHNPNDAHEQAQMRWAEIVLLAGGHAVITDGTIDL